MQSLCGSQSLQSLRGGNSRSGCFVESLRHSEVGEGRRESLQSLCGEKSVQSLRCCQPVQSLRCSQPVQSLRGEEPL